MPTPRVVSLVPSATEIVALFDEPGLLVGRSHECDFPPSLAGVPALTSQATPRGTPAEIDAAVRSQLSSGQSLYTLDTARLKSLKPDIIVTQDLCSVCSIDLATVRRTAESMTPRPTVISLNPHTLEQVLDDVLTIGAALDRAHKAESIVIRLRERLAAAQDFVNPYVEGPNVAFLEWTDPLFIGGHWTVQLIERAGARHPLNPTVALPGSGAAAGPQQAQRAAGKSVRIPAEVVEASRPDVIIICPCGFDLARARKAAIELTTLEWLRHTPAHKAGRIAVVDGNQMFNRPGPRLVDAFEWLVGFLQDRPEVIPPGFPFERL